MPETQKPLFVVLLRDGTSYLIESDDWRYDNDARAFRFFDVDETPEGPKNHEVAWMSETDVLGVAERERISKRRGVPQAPAGRSRDASGSVRRKAAARHGED